MVDSIRNIIALLLSGNESKPGILTTEFLGTVVALILVAFKVVSAADAALIVGPYAVARGIAKNGQGYNPEYAGADEYVDDRSDLVVRDRVQE